MTSVFQRFHPLLQEGIAHRLGWASLRPVQELAGEAILAGDNAVVLAPTAGGKTEASFFPTLSQLLYEPADGVRLLYISPIKALLNNQEARLGTYTEMVGLRRFVWHGDVGQTARKRFIEKPAELLMTTPESLEVMFVSGKIPQRRLFPNLCAVIIDEVHAMAGTDRGAHLMSVVERLARVSTHDIQRIGLSATVGNPEEIAVWLRGSSRRDSVVVDPPAKPAPRELLVTAGESIEDVALAASRVARGTKSLFFCQSRRLTEATARQMRARGIHVYVHHSSVSAAERRDAEAMFESGEDACIVCTSTLELGIDVGDLDRVLQAEATTTVSSFLQRMGRTGRREGRAANTYFFCTNEDSVLQAIALIELARDGWVEPVPTLDRCWPVLVHQLLAMTLAYGAVRPSHVWDVLSVVPDFSGIEYGEYEELIEHMVRENFLFRDGPHLIMGARAEAAFGRRNFMELYAVFSSPQLFTIETMSGKELGSLEQDFVDTLSEEGASFLLGGRAWEVFSIDYDKRRIRVDRARAGKNPRWGGFFPQFSSYEMCQKIRSIIVSDEEFRYLDRVAALELESKRSWMQPLFGEEELPMVVDESGRTRWWTFAGGRINSTLRHLFKAMGKDARADNFSVTLEDGGLRNALEDLRRADTAEMERLKSEVWAALPEYRLSKFQRALPEHLSRELIAGHLLDMEAAVRFVSD